VLVFREENWDNEKAPEKDEPDTKVDAAVVELKQRWKRDNRGTRKVITGSRATRVRIGHSGIVLATETEVQDSERDGGVPIITFNNK